jgi:hypothetical protein
MGRLNFVAGIVAIGGVVVALAVAPGRAFAKPKVTGSLVGYSNIGNGTATDEKSGVGCQDPNNPNLACPSGDFCACITATGAIKGPVGGASAITTEISVDFANNTALYGTPNGSGGSCYGASGIAVVTAANGDELDMLLQGMNCDAVPVGTAPDQIFGADFNGTYSMLGGTGKFASATGTGAFSESLSDVNTANAPATFTLTGSLGK